MLIDDYQALAAESLKSGNMLVGDTGTGKSRVCIAWYALAIGGIINRVGDDNEILIPSKITKNLLIITTAKKRDDKDWEYDCISAGIPSYNVIVDSWNNISKYEGIRCKEKGICVIFDEHHAIGKGAWAKSFINIAKIPGVEWILSTATPGDKWEEYSSVFLANGFFKNRHEFESSHIEYENNPYIKYKRVSGYRNVSKLMKLRKDIIVYYEIPSSVECHEEIVYVPFSRDIYRTILKDRKNPYANKPVKNASEMAYLLRRASSDNNARYEKMYELLVSSKKAIIFYSFDFERDKIKYTLDSNGYRYTEYNGKVHQPIPEADEWAYIVHYSCSEAWNCVKCNTIIFFSPTYSYKQLVQAKGRINRRNTPYKELYYYILTSKSSIETSMLFAIKKKQQFNAVKYIRKLGLDPEAEKKHEKYENS